MIKYCLNSQCDAKFLKQADEIKLTNNDDIFDFTTKYPNKTLIIPWPDFTFPAGMSLENIEKVFDEHHHQKIVFELDNLRSVGLFQKYNLKWYLNEPITTFVEFNRLLDLGAYMIKIQSPLFNTLSYLDEVAPEGGLRLCPNVAYYKRIPARNGLMGSWARPEDIQFLTQYNLTLEFENVENNHKKEEALLRVYQDGEWKGDLNNLVTNLDYPVDNQLIDPTLIEKRVSCGQRCQSGGSCHLCYRHFKIASKDFVQEARNLI